MLTTFFQECTTISYRTWVLQAEHQHHFNIASYSAQGFIYTCTGKKHWVNTDKRCWIYIYTNLKIWIMYVCMFLLPHNVESLLNHILWNYIIRSKHSHILVLKKKKKKKKSCLFWLILNMDKINCQIPPTFYNQVNVLQVLTYLHMLKHIRPYCT